MIDDSIPRLNRPERRLTTLLWASTVGTYLLLAIGGITTILDGGPACAAWPTCTPGVFGNLREPAVIIALGHRIAALVVGVLLAVTLVLAWRHETNRVTACLSLAVFLYPFQVGIGALTATQESAVLSAVHLSVGVGIFALAIFALLWHLEDTHANAPEPTHAAGGATPQNRSSLQPDSAPDSGPDANPPESSPDASESIPERFGGAAAVRGRIAVYYRLMKPRLMWLLCLVAVAAMALAAGSGVTVRTTLATVVGGSIAVGASGTFNNILERDVDQRMDRTDDRPLVLDQISVRRATAFGVVLTGVSVVVFVVFLNVLAALLALLAILFYSIVYTLLLKPHTQQNTVIGGAVGAFPALIGWAAVENTVGVPALVLGAVIFLWTPAHFYNLALAYRDDYARAGFPMLPVVRGAATTRRHILLYLGATLIGSVVLGVMTRLDWLYAITVVLVGGVFLWTVLRLFEERTERAALRTFHASNAFLGSLLLAIFLDTLIV